MMRSMEETLRQHLATCATAFEALTGVKPSVVSRRALQDSRYLDRVIGGEGFTIRTYDRVVKWFSDFWPDPAPWPDGVPRPPKAMSAPLPEQSGAAA